VVSGTADVRILSHLPPGWAAAGNGSELHGSTDGHDQVSTVLSATDAASPESLGLQSS
jgi:hypothetical protein